MSVTAEADDLSFRQPADVEPSVAVPVAIPVSDYLSPGVDIGPALRLLPMPRRQETWQTRAGWTAVAIVVAALYLFMLLSYWAPANPGVDQNGYLVGGRQFALTGSTGLKLISDYDFIGRMWVTAPSGVNYPKYPLGLPILYAICIWLSPVLHWNGYEVAHLISPISTVLAALGVFAITRRLSTGFSGVLAMILFGTGQVMLTLANNPNSHAAGTCTIVWGMYFLLRWLETGTLWRGLLAGFFLGFAYLIRYTDGLMVLTLGVSMLYMARWQWPRLRTSQIVVPIAAVLTTIALFTAKTWGERIVASHPALTPFAENHAAVFFAIVGAVFVAAIASLFVSPRAWWRLFVVGLAWLIPVAYQTIFNMVAMQSLTSYANTNESTGFTVDDFQRNWELMIRTLHDQALFFIAPLGVLGLLTMFRRLPMIASLLALWFVPSVLLYTSYYWAPDQRGVSYSRFILTQVPALVIAASWLLGEVIRRQGRMSWRVNNAGTIVIASLAIVLGAILVVGGLFSVANWTGWLPTLEFGFSPTRDNGWWAFFVPGVVLAIAGGTIVVGRLVSGDDRLVARHFNGLLMRVAVGVIVFIASGVSLYRTTIGSEWGAQMNGRASIEVQQRQNINLAGLGRTVRAAVPDGSILFADGERIHHLQFIGKYETFFTDYFDLERAKRTLLNRLGADTDNPDPIDPSRVKFLSTVYDKKDQAGLLRDMNDLIGKAMTDHRRIFYVLNNTGSDLFKKQLDRRRFDTKLIDTYNDVPPPRWEVEFVPPTQRPKILNRFGGARGGNIGVALAAGEKQSWKIVEVIPMKATTQPAAAPTTKPTTKPAAKPTTKPTTKP